MESVKKKVFIFLYDMEIGGIERSLINMLGSFDYEQFEVDLFICRHTGDFLGMIPEQVNVLEEWGPYTVFRKSIRQCLREGYYRATMMRLWAKCVSQMYSLFKKHKEGPGYTLTQLISKYAIPLLPAFAKVYDLAIGYAWPHDVIVHKVKAKKRVAWIHTDYSQIEIMNEMDLKTWGQFDHIISISDACTESFITRYPSLEQKIIQVENITSPALIQRMSGDEEEAERWLMNHHFNIVSVGRLSPVKGFDLAAQALKQLHDKGLTDIRWYVVGYGGMEGELVEFISQLGLEGKFVLLGKKVNPYPYMKACDVYVQPSRYEGKAVTVTEAQILGKPVVITNYPTASSQVTDGVTGLICDLGVEGIVEGIEKVYKDAHLRERLAHHLSNRDFGNSEELQKLYQVMA